MFQMASFGKNLKQYCLLLRLNKPIGNFLLLWPTLVALWIASAGHPSFIMLFIFVCGVFTMRAAGCVINDLADRKFDGQVARTSQRPLATGKLSIKNALMACGILLVIALALVLCLNQLSFFLAFLGLLLSAFYPFAKRFFACPQFILGIVFNLGILMAFSAQLNRLPEIAWLLYLIAIVWTVVYDTLYAMADRADDIKIGIHSSALLFGKADRLIILLLQVGVLILLLWFGEMIQAKHWYFISLLLVTGLFIYQQTLIFTRKPENCFKAFLNNNWAWLLVFVGVVLNYGY